MLYERPADALPWLEGTWDTLEDTRRRLHAEVLGRLGRLAESAPIGQQLFERTLAVADLHAWLEHLPLNARSSALERARRLALDHDDPVTAAQLLLDIGDDSAAEAALVAEPGRIRGEAYVWLVPLAQSLESHERWVGATAVYRALLNAILARAYAPAYGHGARYWSTLQRIAASGASLDPLEPHAVFEATLRQQHARKASFWARVNGTRRRAASDEDDEEGPD